MKVMVFEYMNIRHVEDMPDETTDARYREIIRARYEQKVEPRVLVSEPGNPDDSGKLRVLRSSRSPRWFDVVNEVGQKLNAKGLSRADAEQLTREIAPILQEPGEGT